MSSDTYTKVVLTVIAVCLLWICADGAWRVEAQQPAAILADERPQPVVIVGWGTVDAKGRVTLTMRGDRQGGTTDPNIPVSVTQIVSPVDVRLEYSDVRPLPVGISQIKKTGEWDPIRSSTEEEPVRSRPGRREQ